MEPWRVLKRPIGHGVQFAYPAMSAKVPAMQGLQVVWLPEWVPATQGLHAVAAVLFWNSPGLHCTHEPCPPDDATVPAAQHVCATLPVDAKWPGSVCVHSSALPKLVLIE